MAKTIAFSDAQYEILAALAKARGYKVGRGRSSQLGKFVLDTCKAQGGFPDMPAVEDGPLKYCECETPTCKGDGRYCSRCQRPVAIETAPQADPL